MLERHAASQFKAQANVSKRFDCCWGSPVYHFYLGVCSLPMVNYSSMRWLIPRFCIYLLVPNSNACWVPISRSGTSRMQSTHNWNGTLESWNLKPWNYSCRVGKLRCKVGWFVHSFLAFLDLYTFFTKYLFLSLCLIALNFFCRLD